MKDRKSIPRRTIIQLIKTRGVLCQNYKAWDFEYIHHIDKDPTNNDFSNLMLLCVTCHRLTHSIRATLQCGVCEQIVTHGYVCKECDMFFCITCSHKNCC